MVLQHSEEKKRKFTETVELQIALKNYDPQKDKRFAGTVKYERRPFLTLTWSNNLEIVTWKRKRKKILNWWIPELYLKGSHREGKALKWNWSGISHGTLLSVMEKYQNFAIFDNIKKFSIGLEVCIFWRFIQAVSNADLSRHVKVMGANLQSLVRLEIDDFSVLTRKLGAFPADLHPGS